MIEVADEAEEDSNVMDLMDGLKQSFGKKADTRTNYAGDKSHNHRERELA